MRLLVDSVPVHTIFIFGFLLADCKAQAETVCNNGASSKKPCPCCMNVLGRTDRASLVGDAYFMHVTDPDMGKAVQFTKDTFNAMADVLRTAATDGTEKHRFDALQMQTGLKYDEHGLIWDPHFREIASCPDSLFWDPQHILLASGGTAQFQCNEFIRNLLKHKITLADLDSFVATVHFPRGHTNLPRNFFAKRYRKGPGKHLKGFAGEMISVISVLGHFADAALKPHNRMRRHTHALDLLRLICNICNDGDRALDRVDILERTLVEHHVMYDRLYAHLSKPKLHFGRHIPQSMRRHGSNMNCFPTERRHQQSIRSAKFIINSMCRSLLAADIHSFSRP